jgi:hypothetical protein
MANKKSNRGSHICKVGFYNINQKVSLVKGKPSGPGFGIYRGKKLVEDGFKNIETVTARAKELLGEKYCSIYSL